MILELEEVVETRKVMHLTHFSLPTVFVWLQRSRISSFLIRFFSSWLT